MVRCAVGWYQVGPGNIHRPEGCLWKNNNNSCWGSFWPGFQCCIQSFSQHTVCRSQKDDFNKAPSSFYRSSRPSIKLEHPMEKKVGGNPLLLLPNNEQTYKSLRPVSLDIDRFTMFQFQIRLIHWIRCNKQTRLILIGHKTQYVGCPSLNWR